METKNSIRLCVYTLSKKYDITNIRFSTDNTVLINTSKYSNINSSVIRIIAIET